MKNGSISRKQSQTLQKMYEGLVDWAKKKVGILNGGILKLLADSEEKRNA